jgi:hypothetical protein
MGKPSGRSVMLVGNFWGSRSRRYGFAGRSGESNLSPPSRSPAGVRRRSLAGAGRNGVAAPVTGGRVGPPFAGTFWPVDRASADPLDADGRPELRSRAGRGGRAARSGSPGPGHDDERAPTTRRPCSRHTGGFGLDGGSATFRAVGVVALAAHLSLGLALRACRLAFRTR